MGWQGCKIVDTHSHYAHPRFDCGRDEILSSLKDADIVAVIEGAIGFETNEKMLKLCNQYPFMYMAAGCHPNCVGEMDEEKFAVIKELAGNEKVLAIGETGLDYAGDKSVDCVSLQKKWFARFIELSLLVDKPLVIHCREAYHDMIEILSGYTFPERPGVIHCFSGNLEEARELIRMGFYIGVGGKFTRTGEEQIQLRETIKNIAPEHIVLETDSPYLLPEGLPGKRNTSLNLWYIVKEMAKLCEVEENIILEKAWENTIKLFPAIE